ncbi:hypothetical protein CI109_103467 [Kwoniella shandongensis]|uniref:Mitochondrial intermembrane space import and assembly protein 40 n=1 Tax=Kwoniella shandongensis TaxID=1734106 RepID=A0A5M6BWA7_9TREE|nr:uncharacterized protein CI109_004630 [Kwoniella shandongensis]KAA5527094.1 hypothetical protein CI109_004630 [Kwoniella shandongensis]
MFARSATRAFRSTTTSSPFIRSLSTSSAAPKSFFNARNALIGGTTLLVSGFALTSERQRVLNDSGRVSALDQPSLKTNLHKAGGVEKPGKTAQKENDELRGVNSATSSPVRAFVHDSKTGANDDESKPKSESKSTGEKSSSSKSSSQSQSEQTPDAARLVEQKSDEASAPAQGAFNEETGEINWDCPCLGGMAQGPCGEQFKGAFSCFVFSEAEPKGVDCVELFKVMQDCFREHPEIYGEEIDDEDDDSGVPAQGASEETKA